MFKIGLGSEVKDKVSGFAGVVISRTEYLNACIRYGVQPKKTQKENGKPAEAEWFDENQLQVTKAADVTKDAGRGPADPSRPRGARRNPR